MGNLTKRRVLSGAGIVLLAGLTGCCSWYWRPGCPPKITTQPQSRTVKQGTAVTFSVVAGPAPVFYQWRFNGTNIGDATNSSYNIASADFSDVGAYTVLVWGSPTNESETAYLSVYSTTKTTTTSGGTLARAVGLFSSQTYSCPAGQVGAGFNKGHIYTNDDGSFAFFYGPQAGTISGPLFANDLHLPFLTVDTLHTDNGNANTGIRIRNNWGALGNACCNDDVAAGTPQSRCDITLGTVTGQDTYRLTVFYKNNPGPPPSGRVTINWTYHN